MFATGQNRSATRFQQCGLDWRDHVKTTAGNMRRRRDLGVAGSSKLRRYERLERIFFI